VNLHALINIGYLVASVLFILGLKGLTHPRTAVRGNLLGALGMLLAIVITLIDKSIISFWWIIVGFVVGAAIGALASWFVKMTGMPEMVALFNGFGGVASVLVAGAALSEAANAMGGGLVPSHQFTIAVGVSGLIGAVTLLGSLVAMGKLSGVAFEKAVLFPGRHVVNALLGLAAVACVVWIVIDPANPFAYWALVGIASLLGILVVMPIGGADMPVVVALLNSYSGLAAAATGFVLNNNVLIIAGSLVGASGIILTRIMCKAMNRSLAHVLFGVLGPTEGGPSADEVYEGKVKATSPEEVAMLLEGARRVVFIPGYGMAVAQAQHAVRNLGSYLEAKGCVVEYAVHPVAGRMPGHMNVLLAEADVPYDNLLTMEQANPTFPQTDVSIIIGANDVVNPVARTDPKSPIAGMPILDADKSRTVVVIKRSLSPGFAGIPNPLFAMDNSLMLFSDAKKAIQAIQQALEEG